MRLSQSPSLLNLERAHQQAIRMSAQFRRPVCSSGFVGDRTARAPVMAPVASSCRGAQRDQPKSGESVDCSVSSCDMSRTSRYRPATQTHRRISLRKPRLPSKRTPPGLILAAKTGSGNADGSLSSQRGFASDLAAAPRPDGRRTAAMSRHQPAPGPCRTAAMAGAGGGRRT